MLIVVDILMVLFLRVINLQNFKKKNSILTKPIHLLATTFFNKIQTRLSTNPEETISVLK